jgi:hypothetical protein
MADPSQKSVLFIPYTFRPYWQPNSGAFPVVTAMHQRLENLTQQLVAAEKKMEEYLRSSEEFQKSTVFLSSFCLPYI